MQKRVNWKYVLPVIALSVFLLLIVLFGSLGPSLAPQITTPPPTCTTPNTIPATINTPTTLCGTITMTAPTVITSGVIVNCLPGTVINYGGLPNAGFDAIQISSGVVSARINGCTFNGPFLSAIHLMPGVLSSQINSNTINGAKNGIIEDYTASTNIYSQNNIQNTGVAMKLEGQQGNTNNNVISNNAIGIFTGIDSATLTSTSPNAICSLGFEVWSQVGSPQTVPTICSIPLSGNIQRINSNSITNNVQGIVVFGTDNQIQSNTIQSNQIGIEVNAIYLGQEIDPTTQATGNFPWSNIQEYFNSGARISQNTISNNGQSGIRTNGRSTYFSMSSPQYHRWTIINGNTIFSNGNSQQDSGGIILGARGGAINSQHLLFYSWNEYTKINSNSINNNNNDGVVLEHSTWMTDIIGNDIQYNSRNGISVGTNQQSTAGGYPDSSSIRYILGNKISNNVQHGIYVYNGALDRVYLNEINSNTKGIYVPEHPSQASSQPVREVDCNDLSYNQQEGFDYDAKSSPNAIYFSGIPWVEQLRRNRVLNNGADGIRYYLDSISHIFGTSLWPWRRTYNNHIEGNGFSPNPAYSISGYGINSQGFYAMPFFANNFVNNALGNAYDSGSNTIENMWDEKQFEKYYDQLTGGNCGGSCAAGCGVLLQCVNGMCLPSPNSGVSCNPLTGNANFYSAAYKIDYFTWPGPYFPRGNYGLGNVIPTSAAPPLQPTSCTGDGQCMTNSCESYPAPINNQQCGNGNFINEPNQFGGYYLPGTVCPNLYYFPSYFGNFPSQGQKENLNEPLPNEEEMYRNLPEEVKKDSMSEQMKLDRRYITEQEKQGLGTPIESLDSLKSIGEQI